jgi:hypothetical protein
MADQPGRLPHIQVQGFGWTTAFKRPRRKIEVPPLPLRNRQAHGSFLAHMLDAALAEAQQNLYASVVGLSHTHDGLYVSFELLERPDTPVHSLENKHKGIRLLSVLPVEDNRIRATVFVPRTHADHFETKIREYLEQNTPKGEPRHQSLITLIEGIAATKVEELWTDATELLPADEAPAWWEVWIQAGQRHAFERMLGELELEHGEELSFPDRAVLPVRAMRAEMERLCYASGAVAELRKHKLTASAFLRMTAIEQAEWVQDMAARIVPPGPNTPAVCLLDTGVNQAHPLLAASLDPPDCQACHPHWSVGDGPPGPHGTGMAGLALLGDLVEPLLAPGPIEVTHRLESVRILPEHGANLRESYGWITREATACSEVPAPWRRRAFCLAVTTDDALTAGRPSAWSAAVDDLCFGGDDGVRRLFCVAAGNVWDRTPIKDYRDRNTNSEIEDPGQSWNALTIGACTEKAHIQDSDFDGYVPLATAGDVSPSSRTSLLWERRWPIKPEILLEGGNWAESPAKAAWDTPDDLALLTTSPNLTGRLLQAFGDTSAATALASRMAAQIQGAYPAYWPETIRALMVHSAEWTPVMRARLNPENKTGRARLLRMYGYGVPSLERALWCAANDLTMVIERRIVPFANGKMKEMALYKLPWPRQALLDLADEPVQLRATLSYFVEPNPASRGYRGRYSYQSHGLRFKLKRRLEDVDQFLKRINEESRDGNYEAGVQEEDGWFLGERARDKGSIHSDLWDGEAADLAARGVITVVPVTGWWKERREYQSREVRYSLILSIRAQAEEVDLYTPVKTAVEQQIAVTTVVST